MSLKPITRFEMILDGQDIAPATRKEYFLKKAAEGGGSGIGYYNTRELLTGPVTVPDLTTGGTIELTLPMALAILNYQEITVLVTDRPLPFIYEDSNSGNIAIPHYINETVNAFVVQSEHPTSTPLYYVRSIAENAKNFVLTFEDDSYIFFNISDVDIVYGYTAGGMDNGS